MKEFDKIIGYTSIKKELEQIADIFKNKEKYDNLGVKPSVGVLIHGVPGIGKSSMANALISAIPLKCFTCRKDKPNGDFVKYIKETFDKATAEAPSIEKYYRRAKEIIASNSSFFENIAKELLEKKILCSKDIENIKTYSMTN